MKQPKRKTGHCHMLLKTGKRCANGAGRNGLCVMHTKQVKEKRRLIDKLIKAGHNAGALLALIKLIELIVKGYEVIRPFVTHVNYLMWHYRPTCREDAGTVQIIPLDSVLEAAIRLNEEGRYDAVVTLAPFVFDALLEGEEAPAVEQ